MRYLSPKDLIVIGAISDVRQSGRVALFRGDDRCLESGVKEDDQSQSVGMRYPLELAMM